MSKINIKKEDIMILYDLVWGQFKEDREAVTNLYTELKGMMSGSPERWAVSGDTLSKYADLMIKQTAQVLDFVKIASKEEEKDNNLNQDDLDFISKKIENS